MSSRGDFAKTNTNNNKTNCPYAPKTRTLTTNGSISNTNEQPRYLRHRCLAHRLKSSRGILRCLVQPLLVFLWERCRSDLSPSAKQRASKGKDRALEGRCDEPAWLPWHDVRWSPLMSMVFKSVVGLMRTSCTVTRDTFWVAQTCAVPLKLLESANDDEEVMVLSDETDERRILWRGAPHQEPTTRFAMRGSSSKSALSWPWRMISKGEVRCVLLFLCLCVGGSHGPGSHVARAV